MRKVGGKVSGEKDAVGQEKTKQKDRKNREEHGMRKSMKTMREFIREEDGMGTVEIILIIAVLVGLVIIFKSQITSLVNSIFFKITSQTNKI